MHNIKYCCFLDNLLSFFYLSYLLESKKIYINLLIFENSFNSNFANILDGNILNNNISNNKTYISLLINLFFLA